MRIHGTLKKWNEERGFGFIEPSGRTTEVFVHATAFPRDGRRPAVGEMVSFRMETDRNGRRRAVDVMRPGHRVAPHSRPRHVDQGRRGSRRSGIALPFLAVFALAAAAGAFAWHTVTSNNAIDSNIAPVVEPLAPALVAPAKPPAPSHPLTTRQNSVVPEPVRAPLAAQSAGLPASTSRFSCDRRTRCSQMTSCAEATFFIHNCSGTRMDGDGDGVPCESQWCTR